MEMPPDSLAWCHCAAKNSTSLHCSPRDWPQPLMGWHVSPPQLLGTGSPHPHSCSPVHSGHGGIYPGHSRCFCFQMKKPTHQEGTCLYHWYNDTGSRLAPKAPIATTQGQVNCWGTLLPDHCIPTSPGPTGRARHGGTAGCFSPFEGCVPWRRLLASLCCIVLFRKTQISLH